MITRILSLAALAAFAGIAAANPTPAETKLQQQLTNLQKDHQAALTQIANLKSEITQGTAKVTQLQNDLKAAKGNDATDSKTIKAAQAHLDTIRKAKYAHTIVYKVKSDTDSKEMQALADDANLFFATAKSVRGVWAGKASAEVGSSADYQVVIVLLFDDATGFQSFQKDSQWKRFTDKHAKLWEEPKYYDLLVGK